MKLVRDALELFFPQQCLVCSKRSSLELCTRCRPITRRYGERCARCQTALPSSDAKCIPCSLFPPLFKRVRFLWHYHQAGVQELINCMKYRPSLKLCVLLASEAARKIPDLFDSLIWDSVVFIPSSAQSMKLRCFNQCFVLAKAIANELPGTRLCTRALAHKGYRNVQASLPHSERLKNVRYSFEARSIAVKGKKILLVEDVITTGATTNFAVAELLNKGASSVDVFALARSEVWNEHRHRFAKLIFGA